LAAILAGATLDIVIDDGFHSVDSIVNTFRAIKPYLSPRFVFFIEDYPGLLDKVADEFTGYATYAHGRMTVVYAGLQPALPLPSAPEPLG
jgi:hypothetical protein